MMMMTRQQRRMILRRLLLLLVIIVAFNSVVRAVVMILFSGDGSHSSGMGMGMSMESLRAAVATGRMVVETQTLPIIPTTTTTTPTTPTTPTSTRGVSEEDNHDHASSYEREFPYKTTCGGSSPTDSRHHHQEGYRNVSIVLAYHVGMVENWKNVVLDQLHTLHQCGLGHLARHLLVSYAKKHDKSKNNSKEEQEEEEAMGELSSLLFPLLSMRPPNPTQQQTLKYGSYNQFSIQLERIVRSQKPPWEAPMMNALHQYCSQLQQQQPPPSPPPSHDSNHAHPQEADTQQAQVVVFYFHNKGVSKYSTDWRNKTHEIWSYSRVLYWRKFLEYFTLERPHLCLHEIVHNHKSVCGCNLILGTPHYSGNFWVATCEYIASLTPLNLSDPNLDYVAAELWIGQKYDDRRFTSLFNRDADQVGLYRHWIQPSEYRFPEDLPPVK